MPPIDVSNRSMMSSTPTKAAAPGLQKEDVKSMIDEQVSDIKSELNTYNVAIQNMNQALEYTNCSVQTCEQAQVRAASLLKQQISELQTESKNALNLKEAPSESASQLLSDTNAHFQVMFETQKSTFESIRMKVDSMDNTYDKRISNLEAIVTPLLSQDKEELTQEHV